jgi:hypothetical protein
MERNGYSMRSDTTVQTGNLILTRVVGGVDPRYINRAPASHNTSFPGSTPKELGKAKSKPMA